MIWKKVNETILPGKEKFYCNLSMEDITEADYKHQKKFIKTLKRKIWQNLMFSKTLEKCI